jgi:hypothetical protein
LLGVLAERLSAADEPFLETALDDRKADVRRTAAGLLARLPDSAYAVRARERAATLLRVERRALRRTLAVTLPPDPDATARRDGIDPRPPDKRMGVKAWLLTQLLAAAPLELWPDLLGARPADLVRLPVADDFAADVHAGWRLATVRQRNPDWARALLHAGADLPARPGTPSDEALAALLPTDERQARAAALLRTGSNQRGQAELAVQNCAPPWSPPLVDAVLDAIARTVRAGEPLSSALLSAAVRGLPADASSTAAAKLRSLAEQGRSSTPFVPALYRAADLLDLRRRFLEELR